MKLETKIEVYAVSEKSDTRKLVHRGSSCRVFSSPDFWMEEAENLMSEAEDAVSESALAFPDGQREEEDEECRA